VSAFSRPRTLYFRDLAVGTVTPTDSDFPWAWGTLARAPVSDTELLAYIAYSVEADRLMREQGDAAWEAFVVANDDRFEPFLLGDNWRLVAADGDGWTATVVNFYADGTVGWR
jgi:hypothetical protein